MTEKLYRVEITEQCAANTFWRSLVLGGGFGTLPSKDSFKSGHYGFIPVGITGWVVGRDGKKFFEPDADQQGLDLFMDATQPDVFFPYSIIKGHYKVV